MSVKSSKGFLIKAAKVKDDQRAAVFFLTSKQSLPAISQGSRKLASYPSARVFLAKALLVTKLVRSALNVQPYKYVLTIL